MSNSLTKTLTVAAAIACALATTAHAAMTISSKKTKNVTCNGGVCTPSGNNPNLNVGDLATMLGSSLRYPASGCSLRLPGRAIIF